MAFSPKLFVLIFFFSSTVQSSKILIFVPGFTDGQAKLFVRFGDLLATSDHNVTLFRPQYNPDVRQHDPKTVGVREIRYAVVENASSYRRWLHETSEAVYRDNTANLWTIMSYALDGGQKFALQGCEKQISDSHLLTTLKKEKFDLAVVDSEDACAFGMVRVLAIPAYTCLSSGVLTDFLAWAAHVPSPTSFVPNTLGQFSDRMSLGQRVQNLAAHTMTPMFYRKTTIGPTNDLFRKYFSDFPDLEKLILETPIIFVNNDEFIDFPRPILHKVVYVGGFSLGDEKPLPGKWKKIMDESQQDGVILISFGNVLKGAELPLKWKAAIINTCAKYPTYTFIFKYDGELEERAKNLTNLITAPWVPQERLLVHPKMKAFVTEGGINSVMESAKHGIPMVIVPLFGDQMGNRLRIERLGVAVGIDKKKFKTKRLVNALEQILRNESYKQNSDRLSRLIKTKPVKPEQLIKGWIDFVAEYKTIPNLQPASLDLSLFQYLLVDAFLILMLIWSIIAYITFRICYCYYWRCCETSFHEKSD